ncbi:MAG: endolytic transglycosylase MltG, partial [Elusimicrobiota bacterium]
SDDYKNTKSPYNTYLKTGLPPGPICSPGLDSVKAVLWPAPSKALFMVAKEDGYHDFSMTYREHVNKVNQRNRRWRALKKGGKS